METISRDVLTFVLNALWQIPLVCAVAALACRFLRQGPAVHRHTIWVAALVAGTMLPLASVYSAARPAESAFVAPPAPVLPVGGPVRGAARTAAHPSAPPPSVSYAQNTATALLAVYLGFMLFRLVRLLRAWRRTGEIRRSARTEVSQAAVLQVWERCLKAFGLRGVELRASEDLPSPVAAGAWRRTVILPRTLLSADQTVLTAAIGHEVAHLARHDFALRLLYEVLALPVAFHPAVWLILRGLEETREMACDELVTERLLDPVAYANSMVNIAATMTALPQPGYTLGVFDRDILERRIRRLLHRPKPNLRRARVLLAGALSALAICAVIAAGTPVTARAQTADVEAKLKAAEALLRSPADPAGTSLVKARQAFLDILAGNPANQRALNGMLEVSVAAKYPQEGRQWALKMVEFYPAEKSSHYCVGFANWAAAYPAVREARKSAGAGADETPLPDANTRLALRNQYGPLVEEGLRHLGIAVEMDAGDSDAMAYTNLLYRLKAAWAETPAESAAALASADEWLNRARSAKKAQPAASPVRPGGATGRTQPPPPPPPPPPQIGATELASDAPMPARVSAAGQSGRYWHVMGSGEMRAKDLQAQLKAQGFPAGWVLASRDKEVRVMVGPYADEAAAAAARSRLEAAGYRVVRSW